MKYSDLLKNKNGVPTYLSLEPIMLNVINDGKNWLTSKLQKTTINKVYELSGFDITDEKRNMTLKRNAGFAVSRLYKQDFIERPFDGTYRISTKGVKLLKTSQNYNQLLTVLDRSNKEYSKIVSDANKKRKKSSKNIKDIKHDEYKSLNSLSDEIDNNIDYHNEKLKALLIKKIMEKDGFFFENVVNKLLVAMGYKGKNGEAITTQPTRDHGVDGIISKDPLGIDTIAFQAKRYSSDNKVGARDIRDFNGYLNGERKGIFITTSTLMESASDELKDKNYPIKIIDGDKLTTLMIEYEVGVQTKKTFKLLNLDNDFFD